MIRREGEANREALKEKAHAWHKRFDEALEEFLVEEEFDFDKFIDVIWEKGILDRVAPKDEEEKRARQGVGSKVWEGERDDPELYWRIMYSAGHIREFSERQFTMHAAGFADVGIYQGVVKLLYSEKHEKFRKKLYPDRKSNPVVIVSDEIIERAKKELETLGVESHKKLIPWGAVGKYEDIEVEVDRYMEDGLVSLRALNYEDHMKLYDLANLKRKHPGLVSPSELDPKDFKLPEDKK